MSTPFIRRRREQGGGSRRKYRLRLNNAELPIRSICHRIALTSIYIEGTKARRDWSGLKGGQFARDRQSKCGGWRGASVGHAESQYVCGLSVLIATYCDGTLRNITSERCPMRHLGSAEALPRSLFRRYSSDENGSLHLLLNLALAVRRRCQLSAASTGLPLPSLCRQRTMRRMVVWSSRDDGLGNQESGTSETRDLRIDSRKHFLSIHLMNIPNRDSSR